MRLGFMLLLSNIPMLMLAGLAYFSLVHGHPIFSVCAGIGALMAFHYPRKGK